MKKPELYFSGSIHGTKEADPHFAWKLVEHIKGKGVTVLSEHVAARTQEERDEVLADKLGMTAAELVATPDRWFMIRKVDLDWVKQASHFVALINAPSHGVGMEIQYALLKPLLGLNETPILCLVDESLKDKVSFMVRGVSKEEASQYWIKSYNSLEEAKAIVDDFFEGNLK